jgi:ATP-dependent Lon protease
VSPSRRRPPRRPSARPKSVPAGAQDPAAAPEPATAKPRRAAKPRPAAKAPAAKAPAAKAPAAKAPIAKAPIAKAPIAKGNTLTVTRGEETFEVRERLPLLPLRDLVVFPGMTIPLLVGRLPSIAAIEKAMAQDRMLFVTAQKRSEVADPTHEELHPVGTLVRILQLFRLPDGTMRVLIEGLARCRAARFLWANEYFTVKWALEPEAPAAGPELEAAQRHVLGQFTEYVHLNRRIPDEVLTTAAAVADPAAFSHTLAAHLLVKVPQKQQLLEAAGPAERLRRLGETLEAELEILKLERKIEGQVRSQVHRNQKEFYLQEQLKAIRKELGHQSEFAGEIDELGAALRKARLPREVLAKAMKELDRLSKMSFMSPEATVVRNYLDWLAALPWNRSSRDQSDMAKVEAILDEDHFGLTKVKERIVEYLAVLKLTGRNKGPILCLVGPPGVGKTSLGRSIARALGRRFVRVALGGVRDEAEIRGHRRTYIGSLPGRIIQSIRRAGTRNPVFLLDEIDKLGADFRGDPASALLEVLDPEQNHTFNDHFLEVDFDLSQVMFICTANTQQSIPPALVDRMETLRLPSYHESEKVEIARRFLIPKQIKAAGLEPGDVHIAAPALNALIRSYTREAGVRNLEREIAGLCRKAARRKAAGKLDGPLNVTLAGLHRLVGPPRYIDLAVERVDRVGIANGLAWTEAGGDVLTIEVSILPGKGDLQLTGKLGEVMRESAHAALTWIRSRAERLGLDRHFYRELDVHVHVPEGATPKDGPSAGISIALAMVSALTGVPTRHQVAMTGELTLRGSVIAVGGIIEKALAARRAGLETVLLPRANEKDLPELPEDVRESLEFVLVDSMEQVLERALERPVGVRTAAVPPAGPVPRADTPEPVAEAPEADPPEYAH